MSEYSHEDFPCEPRANTPGFNKGYEGIKWNDKHDDLGRVVKKEGVEEERSDKFKSVVVVGGVQAGKTQFIKERTQGCIPIHGEEKKGGLVSKDVTYFLKKNEKVLPGVKTIKVTFHKTITMTPELEEKVRTGEVTIEGIDK